MSGWPRISATVLGSAASVAAGMNSPPIDRGDERDSGQQQVALIARDCGEQFESTREQHPEQDGACGGQHRERNGFQEMVEGLQATEDEQDDAGGQGDVARADPGDAQQADVVRIGERGQAAEQVAYGAAEHFAEHALRGALAGQVLLAPARDDVVGGDAFRDRGQHGDEEQQHQIAAHGEAERERPRHRQPEMVSDVGERGRREDRVARGADDDRDQHRAPPQPRAPHQGQHDDQRDQPCAEIDQREARTARGAEPVRQRGAGELGGQDQHDDAGEDRIAQKSADPRDHADPPDRQREHTPDETGDEHRPERGTEPGAMPGGEQCGERARVGPLDDGQAQQEHRLQDDDEPGGHERDAVQVRGVRCGHVVPGSQQCGEDELAVVK
jgi:hypothetical protein